MVPKSLLNSGQEMPILALGTGSYPLPPPEEVRLAVLNAIEVGYRHFDTASMYTTEEPVGRAVTEAIRSGLIRSRKDIFITSKLWCSDTDPPRVLPALRATLKRLGMEYVDLYLIHFPVRLKPDADPVYFAKDDILPFDLPGTWKAMEECQKQGLAKSIGVSNFGKKKITQILQHGTIHPAVNQVEMNVGWQQEDLLNFCKEKGIKLCAWSPLGANGNSWGSLAVMGSPVLKQIAAAKGKSVAQIALRWVYEQGAGAVVRSFNKERMIQNLQIFDCELSEEELTKIKLEIPQRRAYDASNFVAENVTLNDFWDGNP